MTFMYMMMWYEHSDSCCICMYIVFIKHTLLNCIIFSLSVFKYPLNNLSKVKHIFVYLFSTNDSIRCILKPHREFVTGYETVSSQYCCFFMTDSCKIRQSGRKCIWISREVRATIYCSPLPSPTVRPEKPKVTFTRLCSSIFRIYFF